jgi:hypothetical protein
MFTSFKSNDTCKTIEFTNYMNKSLTICFDGINNNGLSNKLCYIGKYNNNNTILLNNNETMYLYDLDSNTIKMNLNKQIYILAKNITFFKQNYTKPHLRIMNKIEQEHCHPC